jgi:hypothetical protein
LIRYLSAEEGVECAKDGDLSICICGVCKTWDRDRSGVRQGAMDVEMVKDEVL